MLSAYSTSLADWAIYKESEREGERGEGSERGERREVRYCYKKIDEKSLQEKVLEPATVEHVHRSQ